VQDTTSQLLEDAPPSTAFAVPSIHVAPSRVSAEVRIRLHARLAGEYWAVTNGGGAELAISGEPPLVLSGSQTATTLAVSERARTVTLTATVPPNRPLKVAFVRRDRLIVDRGYVSPPETCPFR
jgi:hypothetical protein